MPIAKEYSRHAAARGPTVRRRTVLAHSSKASAKIGDYWHVYYDATRHHVEERRRTRHWEPITEMLSFPKGYIKTAAVSNKILAALKKIAGDPSA